VYAVHLHAITVVDDHPDAVPTARHHQGAAFLLRRALHASPTEAARDSATARGLPWIRPPRWLHPHQPLLRDTLHGT
jgi:hypothetical protein